VVFSAIKCKAHKCDPGSVDAWNKLHSNGAPGTRHNVKFSTHQCYVACMQHKFNTHSTKSLSQRKVNAFNSQLRSPVSKPCGNIIADGSLQNGALHVIHTLKSRRKLCCLMWHRNLICRLFDASAVAVQKLVLKVMDLLAFQSSSAGHILMQTSFLFELLLKT